jgi:RES domain-containing protein
VASSAFPLLDGAGAARVGGRWNSPGRRVVYASLSYANALLEVLVHRGRSRVPAGYVWVTLDVPAGVRVARVLPEESPGWDAPDARVGRSLGDAWLAAGREAALVVPAKPAGPHEWNVLLNPGHAEFGRVVAGAAAPVAWDARLWG